MPKVIQYIEVPIIDGVNYVMSETDNVLYYYITGSPVLTTNWAMTIGASVTAGMRFHVQYNATPTLGGNHIYIVGTQIDDDLAAKDFEASGFYDGTSWSIRFFPDWEESGFVQTADIADDAVTNDKLNNITRGSIKVGGASNAPTDLDAKTSGYTLVGDGTDIKSVAISGDATMIASGAVTIANDAVDNNKLANMVRGTVKVGGIANAPTDLVASTNAQILIGNGTDLVSVPVTGDVTITNAGVTTVNPALIGATLWEAGSAGTQSITRINADTGCDATNDYAIAMGTGSVASGLHSIAIGDTDISSGSDAISIGHVNTSSANFAVSIGDNNTSSGISSGSYGSWNTSSGTNSHCIGDHNYATTSYAIVLGHGSTANAHYATAIGHASVANIHDAVSFASDKFNIDGDAQRIDTILKVATTNNVADEMQLADGTDGITIPTDCTANIDIRIVAVQTSGAAGTVGDSFMQNIKLCAKNIAGVSSVVTHNGATLANYSVVAGDVLYELSSCDAAFGGTVVASVSANKLHITVTGENNKDIQWVAYVSLVWTGYRNFSV